MYLSFLVMLNIARDLIWEIRMKVFSVLHVGYNSDVSLTGCIQIVVVMMFGQVTTYVMKPIQSKDLMTFLMTTKIPNLYQNLTNQMINV